MGRGERPMERKLIATFKHGKIGSPQFVARWFLAVIHQKVDFCHFPFLVPVFNISPETRGSHEQMPELQQALDRNDRQDRPTPNTAASSAIRSIPSKQIWRSG